MRLVKNEAGEKAPSAAFSFLRLVSVHTQYASLVFGTAAWQLEPFDQP